MLLKRKRKKSEKSNMLHPTLVRTLALALGAELALGLALGAE